MTVRVSKPAFNVRDKLSELDKPVGLKGTELMRSETIQDARNLIGSGRKNLIINGSCMIDQRNGGSSVTSNYAVDRTHIEGFNGAGTGTGQQVSDAPEGLYKSLKITVTGTDTSLAASDFYTLRHIIEGQNVAHLGFGSADAKTVTLSFWVKSSMTGIFCCSIGNGTNNKTMPKEYNINFANNWEYKTLTFPGATSGTWGTDNGRGFSVRWCMGVGSTRTGTVDTYNGNESHGTSKQTNLFATNGATFQITGMQLELGTVATPLEHRSYGEELTLCQRYFTVWPPRSGGIPAWPIYTGSSQASAHIWIPHTMRTIPTPTDKGTGTSTTTGNIYNNNGASVNGRYANGNSPTLSCGGDSINGHYGLNMHFGAYSSGGHEADIASWNGTSPGIFLSAEM